MRKKDRRMKLIQNEIDTIESLCDLECMVAQLPRTARRHHYKELKLQHNKYKEDPYMLIDLTRQLEATNCAYENTLEWMKEDKLFQNLMGFRYKVPTYTKKPEFTYHCPT